MSLRGFQQALGRMVMAASTNPDRQATAILGIDPSLTTEEHRLLRRIATTPGFRLTGNIHRSWCKGRAAKSAYLTLSALSEDQRERLLDQWVGTGRATGAFVASSSSDFLEFIAHQLPDPSHELCICRFEQAVVHASIGLLASESEQLPDQDCEGALVRAGRHANLVTFFGEPSTILDAAVNARPLPRVLDHPTALLFAPRIPGHFRIADTDDIALWRMLAQPVSIGWLTRLRPASAIKELLYQGVMERVAS